MIATVRYFGPAKPFASREAQAVELAEGARVADLVRLVQEYYGNLADGEGIVFLVNEKAATQETPLCDGDQVFILRPLGGG